MRVFKFMLPLVAAATASGSTWAHHSYAVYDNTKEVTITGTVKEFQWTAPHCFLQIVVTGSKGKTVEWSLSTSSPIGLKRMGWARSDLKPGDKVRVTIHPLKDGRPGGSISSVVTAKGKILKNTA